MFAHTGWNSDLLRLSRRQSGVVTRRQLVNLGASQSFISSQIRAARWTPWARNVILLQNARPTRSQLMRIALLDAGPSSALASHTSLQQRGFRGFARESTYIHIIVPRGAKCYPILGIVVHESRWLTPQRVRQYDGFPCVEAACSAIHAGAWQRWARFACTMLAAAVQQRVCAVDELDEALRIVGQVRHKSYMRLALADIRGGAESLGEINVAALCRRFGLVPPARQRLRRDPSGRRRYLDCEWELPDGSIVVLEVDGTHHHLVEHWEQDMKRERTVVISRRWVLRASASEVRLDAAAVFRDLTDMGVPRAAP